MSISCRTSAGALPFLAVFLILSPIPGVPQSPSDPRELSVLSSDTLFERADRSVSARAWLAIAEAGIAGFSGAEREAAERELGSRLAGWGERRLQERMESTDLAGFLALSARADTEFLYQTDRSGAVRYDEAGDPMMKGILGIEDGTGDAYRLETDIAEREKRLRGAMGDLVDRWERSARVVIDGIASTVSGLTGSRLRDALMVSLNDYRRAAEREFEIVYLREQARFTALRSRDTYSLRRKSEQAAAGELASALIAETGHELAEVRTALLSNVPEPQRESVPDLTVNGESPETAFREAYELGLEKWDRAENRFLEERLRWELSARQTYTGSEAVWDDAFGMFAEARKRWAEEMARTFEEGRAEWKEKTLDFDADFAIAAQEIEHAAASGAEQFSRDVSETVAAFRSSVDVVAMAGEYLNYYRDKPDEAKEYQAWETVRDTALEAQEVARRNLSELEKAAASYGSGSSDGYAVAGSGLEGEIERMERRVALLDRQLAVSRAVLAYAEDRSSARPTEAMTEERFRAGEAALDVAREAYDAAREELSAVSRAMSGMNERLRAEQHSLELAGAELDGERSRFQAIWTAWTTLDADILRAVTDDLHSRIDSWFVDGRSDAYRSWFIAAEADERNRERIEAERVLRDLLGTESVGQDRLLVDRPILLARVEALDRLEGGWKSAATDTLPVMLIHAGIDAESVSGDPNPDHHLLLSLFEAAREESDAGRLAAAKAEGLLSRIRLRAWEDLAENDAAEALLFPDGSSGSFDRTDLALTLERAEDGLYASRAALLRAAARRAGGLPLDSDPEPALLAVLVSRLTGPNRETPAALDAVSQLLDRAASGTLTRAEALAAADDAGRRELFLAIVSGSDDAVDDGIDLAAGMLRSPLEAVAVARARLTAFDAFGDLRDSAFSAARTDRAERIRRILGYDSGALLPEDRFPDFPGHETTEDLVDLFEDLESSDGVPGYLLGVLQEYLAAVVRRDGLHPELPGSETAKLEVDILAVLQDGLASAEDPLQIASFLYSNALPGGRESVLLFASEAVSAARDSDPGETLAAVLRELGLAPGAITIADVETFDFEAFLPEFSADYVPYRDGPREEFPGSRPPAGNVFADAVREAVLQTGSSGTQRDLDRTLMSLLKRYGMDDLSQRSARLLRRISAMESVRTVLSILPERPDAGAEAAAFADLLSDAVEILSGASDSSPAGTAYEKRNAILLRREQTRQNVEKAAELEAQLENRETAGEEYHERFVVPARADLERAREVHRLAQESFDRVLEDYSAETVRYGEASARSQDAWRRFREARSDYQEAAEIREYAAGGYDLVQTDPKVRFEERRSEYQRAMQALEILRSIPATDKTDGFAESLDGGYLEIRNGLREMQEQVGYVLNAFDTFGAAVSAADRRIAGITEELTDTIGRFFLLDPGAGEDYGDFRIVLDSESGFDMFTDCRTPGNDSIDEYFSGDAADEKYSRDMLLFLREIGASGDPSGMLRAFGDAYYVRNPMQLSVTDDPYFQRLSPEYAPFYRRVENPDYRPAQDDDGPGYLRTRNTPFIDVRISSREWLLDRCRGTLDSVVNGSEKTRKLFAFYELMLQSGRMQPGVRDAVDYRLSRELAEYVDDRAHDRQRSYLKWWKFWKHAEGRTIREYRRNMNGYSGVSAEKSEILRSAAVTAAASSAEYLSLQEHLDELLGGTDGKPVEFSDLAGLMEKETGIELSPEAAASLRMIFDDLGDAERRSNFSALTAVRDRLEQRISVQRQQAVERIALLRNDRNLRLSAYRAAGSAKDLDAPEFARTAAELFRDPVFTEEDYLAAELHFSRNTRSYHPRGEAEVLEEYGRRIIDLFRFRLDQTSDLQYEKLASEREELERRRQYWEERTGELLHAGLAEWNEGLERMIGVRQTRQNQFAREYDEKSRIWEDRYERWGRNRQAWITEGAERTVQAGTTAMLRQMGLEADARIADAEMTLIPDMSSDPPDLGRLMRQVLGGSTLDRIIEDTRRLAGRARTDPVPVAVTIPLIGTDRSVLRTFTHLRENLMGEVVERAALAQASMFRDQLESTETRVEETIEEANRGFEDNLDRTLLRRGYRRSGGQYERRAVVDASLFGGPESETQRIAAYRWFAAPEFDTGVDLSRAVLQGSNPEVIQAKVAKAQENLRAYLSLIFGNKFDDGKGMPVDLRIGLDRRFLEMFEAAERDFASSSRAAEIMDSSSGRRFGDAQGLFAFHVGYLPVPDQDNPERMKKSGYGELGRIYERFFVHEARLSRGFALAEMPWYSQRLWDDDADNDGVSDGIFGAPSVRSVTDIGLSVVAATLTAGQSLWANAALMTAVNLTDDLVFTAADAAGGYRDPGDAWSGFGKKAAIGMLSSGLGVGTGSLDRMIGFSDTISGAIWETGTDTMLAGARTAGTLYGNAILGNIEFARLGSEDWFDYTGYGSASAWKNMKTGLASGMGGALVSSGFDTQLRGYLNRSYSDGSALHALAGGLTGSAIEYGMSGRTELNILSFADLFGSKAARTGLLELNIGGGGNLFTLGSGGTSVNVSTLEQAQRGLDLYRQNDRIRRAGLDSKLTGALRMAYSAGRDETLELYEQLLDGRAEVRFLEGAGSKAETTRESDRRIIGVQHPVGTGADLQLGVLLAHEAFRNGIDDGAEGQRLETARAVLGHLSAARSVAALYGRSFLDPAMRGELNRFEQARMPQELHALVQAIGSDYDSSADYWKLVMNADGGHHLEADGSKSLTIEYRNTEGNPVSSLSPAGQNTGNKGWAESLATVVGLGRAESLLGSKLTNSDLFDAQTLRDVLQLSDRDIARVQRSGSLSGMQVSEQQFLRLAGEALLKSSGASWNPQTRVWDGAEGINGLKLTDRMLEGNILARVNPSGGFDYSTISAEVFRNRDSYQGWSAHEGPRYNSAAQGLDTVSLTKRDLSGNLIDSVPFGGFHTVDNMTSNRDGD